MADMNETIGQTPAAEQAAPVEKTGKSPKLAKKQPYRTAEQCRPWYNLCYPFIWIAFRILYGLKVYHRERIPEGACVICPRHCSAIDPPMVAFALKKKLYPRVMAKQELLDIPVIGWFLYMMGVFGVQRGSNDMASIKSGLKALKEGSKLMIFPEGTRVKTGDRGQAQTGAIMFALKSGVPLVPVYLSKAERFQSVKVVFGEPYLPQIAGKRATAEEYRKLADELLDKIYALESEIV